MNDDAFRPGLRVGWIVALVGLTIFYRVASASHESLGNTSPLMALCFGGGLLLGYRFCWVPVVLLLASDLALGLAHGTGPGAHTAVSALAFTAAAAFGAWLFEKRRNWGVLWLGTLACSAAFYGIMNTLAWAASPEYAKTAAGWWQSQTTGLPQYSPPAWAFLRNALVADTIWCLAATPLFYWHRLRLPSAAQPVSAGL
ncbi:MAG: hypothetical protein H7A52_07565 [Akkermansiaceae bacterium]|nr:hypothetical protein [Akkermansiaceae bacterium]